MTIAGAMGLKAVAAAKAASAAAKQAAAQAIAMAQNTNLAALQAEQAQANLEKYVYGVPVSSIPPSVSPMPPAAIHPYPMKAKVWIKHSRPRCLWLGLYLDAVDGHKTKRRKRSFERNPAGEGLISGQQNT